MVKNVLVLTSSAGFGELIRQFFEETGSFVPVLHFNVDQALDEARQSRFELAILDADSLEVDLPEMVEALRAANTEIRLIVIPGEEPPDDLELAQIQADQVLPSPFYLPDLMSALEDLFGAFELRDVRTLRGADAGRPPSKPVGRAPHAAPEWLADVTLAAQYLTRLSLESAAQAALITRNHEVWAYAGGLPQPAAEELARELANHWEDAGADLARFVHLEATRGDYMLYATSLGGDYILAMVFDAEMPFSQMRTQASEMAEALAVAPKLEMAADNTEEAKATRGESDSAPTAGEEDGRESNDFEPEMAHNQVSGHSQEIQPSDQRADVAAHIGGLETTGSYDLHYAYVMIPRLPSHRLDGDLAEKLAHWLPQLCLAFGWRLEQLNVQPSFLQWAINVAPDASPESVANTLGTHLSGHIFDEFPRLQRENPSGKFWAPGFLIVSGAAPSDDLIAEYIQQTRRRQGVPRSG